MSAVASGPVGTLRVVARDIKLVHSVFALPFAVFAAVLAFLPDPEIGFDPLGLLGRLGLVVLAMVFARSFAMLANRLVDREIDARNPRTARRAIPAGELSVARARGVAVAAAGMFQVTAIGFGVFYGNFWPAALAVPVLAWIGAYSYIKRFSALCHLYLGASLALSPVAAALAIDPAALAMPAVWLVAGMVLCWVAGFDVIYALQDVEVDRAEGLYSLPSRMGIGRSLWVSRCLHVAAVCFLVAARRVDPRLGWPFLAGVAVVAGLLAAEHATVARWGTSRIALAFFTLNGLVSCLLGALGVADVFVS